MEIAHIHTQWKQEEKVLDELIERARLQTGYAQVKAFVEKKGINLDSEKLREVIQNQTRKMVKIFQ
eukprot:750480-Hanusia_phi.AAC.7